MKSPILFAMTCAFLCGSLIMASPSNARQEDETLVDEERLEFVVDQCVLSIRDSIRTTLDLKIDFVQRFLRIDESELRKIRVYSKGLSAKHARLYRKSIGDRLRRFATQIEGSTFSINGQSHTFEGEEENAVPDFRIRIKMGNEHSRGTMTVFYSNRSSGFGISAEGNKPLSFESSNNFRKALSAIEVERLQSVSKTIEARRKQNVVNAMAIMLGDKLDLREDQMPPMEDWIGEHVGNATGVAIYPQLRDRFRNSQIFDKDPEFLTDIQLDAWRILKNSQYPFGW